MPDFAFAFDIDGVLVRSSDPLPGAHETLSYLQKQRIPFILLTNGGGKTEQERVDDLSEKLGVRLDVSMLVQSHTPFAMLDDLKEKTVLVCGGDGDRCRHVAHNYGFKNVVMPHDILVAHPEISPFSKWALPHYRPLAKSLPKPIHSADPSKSLKIDAIFVYNDPRDWGLDSTVILDLLMSKQGILGTLSDKNNNEGLPNRGYLQDDQPHLYYSNPDLWWAAKYHLSRLGQGGFRESFEGLWAAVTGGPRMGVELQKTVIGKPFRMTYEFAERRLLEHRRMLFGAKEAERAALKRVYMVGDNPESDIRGANTYQSECGSRWDSILVKTGVYTGGESAWKPTVVVERVEDAVRWAVEQSRWEQKKG